MTFKYTLYAYKNVAGVYYFSVLYSSIHDCNIVIVICCTSGPLFYDWLTALKPFLLLSLTLTIIIANDVYYITNII